ncbi:MAG: hypothetical protein QNJ16_11940 [Rhodobacter sp.]|nr:hypothetical protein [Rhodobacter sp.]
MGWITLILYVGVILVWLVLVYRAWAGPRPVPKPIKTNLIGLTVILAVLTAMRAVALG